MRTFLLKDKSPILKWKHIPEESYFEGEIPEGYSLAVSPNNPYIILDIDKHGDINGFDNIPSEYLLDLSQHFCYDTKRDGRHYWLKYTGGKTLINRASGLGIDLRNNRGYAKWYLDGDIRDYIHEIKETSPHLNSWIESLFCGPKKKIHGRI